MTDNVNHPKHYTSADIECIEAIEAACDDPVNFYRGTVLKYIWRSGKKANEIEGLEKAVWYLNRWIKRMKAEDEKSDELYAEWAKNNK